MMEITEEIATKVRDTVAIGLTSGLGNNVPGEMCIEAAVCYAIGEPHSDRPSCVGEAVRTFKITLNDSNWSSDSARAKGLARIAIAQLGSNQIDQVEFVQNLTIANVNTLLADLFEMLNIDVEPSLREVQTLDAAASAGYAADAAGYAARAGYAAASTAASAGYAADAAGYAAGYAAVIAAASAGYAADADAARAGYAAASTAGYAADAAGYAASDEILTKAAEIAVQILIDMECPGTKFLYLLENTNV